MESRRRYRVNDYVLEIVQISCGTCTPVRYSTRHTQRDRRIAPTAHSAQRTENFSSRLKLYSVYLVHAYRIDTHLGINVVIVMLCPCLFSNLSFLHPPLSHQQ